MKECGFTAEALAAAINDAALRQTGTPTNATQMTVHRWLTGATLWPWTRYHRPLTEVFGRPLTELGFIPRGRQSAAVLSNMTVPASGSEEGPVLRREFLTAAGGVVTGSLPILPKAGRIGMSDIDRINAAISTLHARDDQYGGTGLAELSERYVSYLRTSMAQCTMAPRVQSAAYSTMGSFSASGGWFALDAGDHATAARCFDAALRFGTMAGDRSLQAQAWNSMSMQARYLGNTWEAAPLAEAGIEAAGRSNPRLRSLLYARAAVGYARRGDATQAYRCLSVAERAYGRDSDPGPPWLQFYTELEFYGLSAYVHHELGQFANAEVSYRESLSTMPDQFSRNRHLYTAHLALNQLAQRDVERACETAREALATVSIVRSRRALERLVEFRNRVAAYKSTSCADAFIRDYDRTLHEEGAE